MGNNPSKAPPTNKWQYVPRSAKRPGPPGRPDVVPPPTDEYLLRQQQPDVITVRWEPPESDGGTPITGYLVERRDMGATVWVRAHAALAREPEVALAGLEPGRRYQFRVCAENALGLSQPSEPSAPISVSAGSVATVPHFMKELKDSVAIEHEKVTFSVHVLGTPTPHISWYKDAFEVFSSKRIRVITDNERSSLTFYQVALSDEGDIKCTATNRAGHVVTKARLRIEAPPRVKLPKQYEEGLLFELDDVIRLKVTVTGRPTPSITWLHNGEELQNDARCEVVTTERSSSVRLLDSRREDRGEYVVRAHNELGEDLASVLVTVTDRPCPPGKAQIAAVSGRSVLLEWEAPEDDGGCKIGNYVVEYYRIGWNVWLKAATCRQLSATLDDLIEGSEYKFRVKAENPYGMSDPGEESSEVFIPDPKRGLLSPPSKNTASSSAVSTVVEATDEWLEERRRRRAAMFEEYRAPSPPPVEDRVEDRVGDAAIMEEEEEKEEDLDYSHMSDEEDEEMEEETSRAGSELMLVLVPSADKIDQPREGTKKEAPLSRQQSLDAPPPMSLSAPELSALGTMRDTPVPLQLQRNAVSSTELLHEKAMARLYQALAAEEAQAEKRRHEGMAAEDARERQEEQRGQDLPRATITDTGQQSVPQPEKLPLKPALKKPKRKIPDPKPDDDLLDTKKTKSSYKAKTTDDLGITVHENGRPLTPASKLTVLNRPTTPLSLKEVRPYTPEYNDLNTDRPLSPYLRGPTLHKYDYEEPVEPVRYSRPSSRTSSRPTSPYSTRSISPFSKVQVMDEPPEGYDYEPSPPPSPPPPVKQKVKKVKKMKDKIPVDDVLDGKISPIENIREPEIYKIPTVELTEPQEYPRTKSPVEISRTETPEELKTKKIKTKKGVLKTKVKKVKEQIPAEIEVPKIDEPMVVDEPKVESPKPEKVPKSVLKKTKKVKTKVVEEPKIIEIIPEEPKSDNSEASEIKEAKKSGLKTKLKKVKEKFPGEKKTKEVKIVEPVEIIPEAPPVETQPEKPSGKEKKSKEKKTKEKKSKKDKTEKAEGEESDKQKAKKGFSILGVKLRRPTEMQRGGDADDDNPEAPSRRRKSQRQIPQVRLSSSFDKSEEEAEARAIIVERYGELINDVSKNRRFINRRQYLDREELKEAVGGDDEEPSEASMSPSPVLENTSSPVAGRKAAISPLAGRKGTISHQASPGLTRQSPLTSPVSGRQGAMVTSPVAGRQGFMANRPSAQEEFPTVAPVAKLKHVSDDEDLLDEEDEEEEDWEEESSRMSELPPSPPRSATPSHTWLSPRPDSAADRPRSTASSRASSVSTGESARATVSLLTNAAVVLVVLWLSITVDWHLGLGVAVLVIARKIYVAAKAKFQQLTGWGQLKKKERTPPSTPPPTPQLQLTQREEQHGDAELDYIEEEDEDFDEDYSEEHSIPYEPD